LHYFTREKSIFGCIQGSDHHEQRTLNDAANKLLLQQSRAYALVYAARVNFNVFRRSNLDVLVLHHDRAELQSKIVNARIIAVRFVCSFDHDRLERASFENI
jgi:hypothetical protein